jgi:hypothetical protein
VHSRSGDNLTAHPEAAGIIRQASGFPPFDEFLGPRLALPAVQLDHPHGTWQVKTKLPHRAGEMGHPRSRFWRQQEIYGQRINTQREANYAQLARHAASGAIPSTRHHCLPVEPTRNIRTAGHQTLRELIVTGAWRDYLDEPAHRAGDLLAGWPAEVRRHC